MKRRFDHFLAIDWSGANKARHQAIALAIADADGGPPVLVNQPGGWSRQEVLAILRDELPDNTLVGLDLGISLAFDDLQGLLPRICRKPGGCQGTVGSC